MTIICARTGDGRYVGFTANSFNSVSLDPPLVLWSLSRRSASLPAFEAAERYSVNVLSADADRTRAPLLAARTRTASPASATGWAGRTRR